jgi:F0F1-type ATP synthase assembly protein I
VTKVARVRTDDGHDGSIDARTLVGLGGFLVGCVVVGLLVGWLADNQWGSEPVGILIGLGVGVVVGLVGSALRVAGYLRG